ncbi:hypothetical protein [Candidatus Phytoplasma tritici]|uniref:hypothetical protein n=1 Tax=Candidatus Phytoplasma tritici TaxID=321961 RepID=UPI0003FEB233|nr:hypothetical protein [Candidatus Phytoplasma tritici]
MEEKNIVKEKQNIKEQNYNKNVISIIITDNKKSKDNKQNILDNKNYGYGFL